MPIFQRKMQEFEFSVYAEYLLGYNYILSKEKPNNLKVSFGQTNKFLGVQIHLQQLFYPKNRINIQIYINKITT